VPRKHPPHHYTTTTSLHSGNNVLILFTPNTVKIDTYLFKFNYKVLQHFGVPATVQLDNVNQQLFIQICNTNFSQFNSSYVLFINKYLVSLRKKSIEKKKYVANDHTS